MVRWPGVWGTSRGRGRLPVVKLWAGFLREYTTKGIRGMIYARLIS